MTATLLSLNLDLHPPRPRHVDPDARADALLDQSGAQTLRARAIQLATEAPLTSETLAAETGCSRQTAHNTLAALSALGTLLRLERGVYGLSRAMKASPGGAQRALVAEADGVKAAFARKLAAADAFLSAREPLPAARAPQFHECGGGRR